MSGVYFVCLSIFVLVNEIGCRRIVDLTYDLEHDTITYPVNPKFNLSIQHAGPLADSPWVEFGNVEFAEHTGTHVDSPNHFYKYGIKAHQIKLEQLMGSGVIIDVKDKVENDNDYRITDEDLMDWEKKHGKIPKGAIVLMYSGWGTRYPNWNRVFNTDDINDHTSFHYPSFGASAAQWLVDHRDVNAIGVDVPATDYGRSKSFPVHNIMAKEGILMIENVANMNKLPACGAYIYVPMLKFKGGTGAPARMFAALEDEGDRENAGAVATGSVSIAGVLAVFTLYMA